MAVLRPEEFDSARLRAPWPLRLLAVALAVPNLAAAAWLESMTEDGVSYLDVGSAYFEANWAQAINGTWSPLYSWILGFATWLIQPSMRWEYPLVQIMNFLIFLAALACFEFFWRQLTRLYFGGPGDGPHPSNRARFSPVMWHSIGYLLFMWTSLSLNEIWAVTPDMCVMALVYAASGLLVQLGERDVRSPRFLVFGFVLGLAYLAKAAMFPLAFLYLAGAAVLQGKLRPAVVRASVALAAFTLVAGPFIAALSIAKGGLTFGEVGKLTYLKHVWKVPFPQWRPGEVEGIGQPLHPARRIGRDPTVYEFATPVGGTYPISYEPSYWYEGLTPRLDLRRQVRAVLHNARFYADLFVREQGIVLAAVLIAGLASCLDSRRSVPPREGRILSSIALVAFLMYLVVYVEGRYVAPFVVLFWSGLLTGIGLPHSRQNLRFLGVVGATLLLGLSVNLVAFHLSGLNQLIGYLPGAESSAQRSARPQPSGGARPSEVSTELLNMGLERGDTVGVIGYSIGAGGAFWARLARLRITAEIPSEEAARFWDSSPARQARIVAAFAGTGVRAIVSEHVPADRSPSGWQPIGDTGFHVRLLDQPGGSTHGAGRSTGRILHGLPRAETDPRRGDAAPAVEGDDRTEPDTARSPNRPRRGGDTEGEH